MISVEDWAEIRRLHKAEKLGVKTIARRLGIARNTVRAAMRLYIGANKLSAVGKHPDSASRRRSAFPTCPNGCTEK